MQPMWKGVCPHPPSRLPGHLEPSPFCLPRATPRPPSLGRIPTSTLRLCSAASLLGWLGSTLLWVSAGKGDGVPGLLYFLHPSWAGPTDMRQGGKQGSAGREASAGTLVLTPTLPVHKRRWCLVLPRHGRWLPPGERAESGKGVVATDPGHPRRGFGPILCVPWRRTKTVFVGEKDTRSWGGF